MATTASQVQYRYNMIEDYALAEWPPVAQDVQEAFLTLQPTAEAGTLPATELLTVSHENNLMHFIRDASASSGWNQVQRNVDGAPYGKPISKLIGFYQDTTLFALAHYPANGGANQVLGMQKTPDRGWAAMPMTPNLTNALGAMTETDSFVDAKGTVYVYGISENLDPRAFVILAASDQSEQWDFVWEQAAVPGATYRLLPGQDGNDMTVMTIEGSKATFRGASVIDGMLVWSKTPAITHDLGEGDFAARQVFPIPSQSGDPGFLLLSSAGGLFHIAGELGSKPTVLPMTGGSGQPGGARQVSVGLDSQQRWMVFVIDQAANTLWLLRQSESSAEAGPIAFDDWVQLGNALHTIACPVVMTAGPELFFYDLDAKVSHMAQELKSVSDGTSWFTTTLATPPAPETAPTPNTTYTQEIVAADANGTPVPKSVMKLYTDRKTVMVANGISYHVGPHEPATVEADRHGIVTVSTGATALSSPKVRATASGFSAQQNETYYRADLRVHQRLAGQDKRFPVTAASMRKEGLLPAKMSSSDAKAVAKHITTLAAAAVHKQSGENGAARSSSDLPDAGLVLDFAEAGRIKGSTIVPGTLARPSLEALSVDISLNGLVGDAIHFFKHAADEVKSIAVHIEKGVVSLAINGLEFVLNTVSEIADAIELVFKKIEALYKDVVKLVEKLLTWLRLLLELKAIIRTKEVLKYYLEHGIQNVAADLNGALPDFLDAKFAALQKTIDQKLGDLKAIFGSSSFNGLAPKSTLGPLQGGPPLEANSLHGQYRDDAVRCNFVRSRAEPHMGALPSSPSAAAPGAGSLPTFQDLITTFSEAFPTAQLEAKFEKMVTLAKGFDHASTFLDTTIVELLEALDEVLTFVLGGIKAVLDVLFKIAGGVVSSINEMITHTISIPIISWLYKEITGSELSILDLFCLILAAPVTFLYEAFNGSAPFSSSDVSSITSKPLPWPSIPSGAGSAAMAAPRAAWSAEPLPTGVATALGFTAGILWLVYGLEDVVLDVALANGSGVGPPLVGLALVLTGGAIQLFSAPWDLFENTDRSDAEDAVIAAWAAAWLPVIVSGVAVSLSPVQGVTRFIEAVGPWVDLVLGTTVLAVGVVAVGFMGDSTDFNVTDRIVAILPNFPVLGKPLALIPDEIGLAVIGIVDFAGDMGTGAALMIGQVEEA